MVKFSEHSGTSRMESVCCEPFVSVTDVESITDNWLGGFGRFMNHIRLSCRSGGTFSKTVKKIKPILRKNNCCMALAIEKSGQ